MTKNIENTNYMQALNEAYENAYQIYLNHKQDPANKELDEQYKIVCEKYTGLLEEYKIGLGWVYNNHFGLWEYHPSWKKFVSAVTKELEKARSNKQKIDYLNNLKRTIIDKGLKHESFKEPIPCALAMKFVDDKIAKLQELQEINDEEKVVTVDPEQRSNNYSTKERIFFDDKMQPFAQIESKMVQEGFIKNTGEWATQKNKLVALIHILYKLRYLKQAGSHDKERIQLNKHRRFFEERYTINITKAFQPSQFDVGKLKSYRPDFRFIPEIDKV